MKKVKLIKKRIRLEMLGEIFEWDGVEGWPFDGGVDSDWGQGHRCSCGNVRFVVCHRAVEITAGVPGAEPTYRHEYRNVCGQCIRFHAGEMILGELDYSSMIAYVYDSPTSPRQMTRDPRDGLRAMDFYVPVNVDYFDISEFDRNQFYPPVIERVTMDAPAPMRAPTRRGRKGKILPNGPTLGFTDEASSA